MQGFNMGRYYPPPDSSSTSNPTFNKSHPLGARARKLKTQGILTVRFEMPFAIWCNTCPKPTIIGQGVRFNAEKKKVGNYFSTPIWSFRMKHAACGGSIEIHTDPKASEYVVVEGAKRRDYGEDRVDTEGNGLGIVLDEAERARRREDAMAGLEGKRDEEVVKKDSRKRIEELLEDRERSWADPYEASRMVRKGFRRERKERHREAGRAEEIKSRLGLALELLPSTEEDALRAKLVDFDPAADVDAATKPLFDTPSTRIDNDSRIKHMTRTEKAKARTMEGLQQSLRAGTHAAADPFNPQSRAPQRTNDTSLVQALNGVRKAKTPSAPPQTPDGLKTTSATTLVNYDSD